MNISLLILYSFISALVLNLLKDFFERSRISFDPSFAKASEGRRVFTAEHSRSIRTSAASLIAVFLLLMINKEIHASAAPYIPSYDDYYTDDLALANANKNNFEEPDDTLNYANYCYVGAHAAEKYPRFFPQYALQEQPIPSMLAVGARGLMLSVYNWDLHWKSINREGVSVVCSHPNDDIGVLRKNGKPLYQTLHYEMNRIFNFLKSHPKAVITIWFEDLFQSPSKMIRDIQEIITLNKYDPFLKPSDWKPAQEKNEWPTLGWMRKNNKRLLLFTQNHDAHTEFTWPIKQYFWENNYGSADPNVACSEEKESVIEPRKQNRSFVSFGCYGEAGAYAYETTAIARARNPYLCFLYTTAKNLAESCQRRRFARGKLFNAYWVDHVINAVNTLTKDRKKTVFDYINERNKAAVTSKKG